MNTKKKPYTPPELTVVTFKTKRGYSLSGIGIALPFDTDTDTQPRGVEAGQQLLQL